MSSVPSAERRKKVKQYIESEIVRTGLQDYVSQVLIPMEKFYQIKDGKKVSKERAIFRVMY
jgi:transcriptional antiterminator NusG